MRWQECDVGFGPLCIGALHEWSLLNKALHSLSLSLGHTCPCLLQCPQCGRRLQLPGCPASQRVNLIWGVGGRGPRRNIFPVFGVSLNLISQKRNFIITSQSCFSLTSPSNRAPILYILLLWLS